MSTENPGVDSGDGPGEGLTVSVSDSGIVAPQSREGCLHPVFTRNVGEGSVQVSGTTVDCCGESYQEGAQAGEILFRLRRCS